MVGLPHTGHLSLSVILLQLEQYKLRPFQTAGSRLPAVIISNSTAFKHQAHSILFGARQEGCLDSRQFTPCYFKRSICGFLLSEPIGIPSAGHLPFGNNQSLAQLNWLI